MFKYYLRRALRDRASMFWSLAFPLLLMLCFSVTFMPAARGEFDFDPVKCAVIRESEGAFADEFDAVLEELSDAEKVKASNLAFDHEVVQVVEAASLEEAEKMILTKQIHVIFLVDAEKNQINVKVGEDPSTMTLMVARSVSESFRRNYTLVQDAMTTAPNTLEQVMACLNEDVSVMKQKGTLLGDANNPYLWYFYSTIVMSMFFNCSAGVKVVFDIEGNLSGYGMRTSISPMKKSKILLSSFFARYLIADAITFFHIFSMKTFFDVPMGNRLPLLILFVLVGNLFSISLGSMFGLFTKGNHDMREGKATGLIMLSVFLSGEMVEVLPGVFEKYCPIINRVNPATLMNFAFYRLVYYENLNSFWINLCKIGIATFVFLTIAVLRLRREKYAAL